MNPQLPPRRLGSIFNCVDANDLYKREERAEDQPQMKIGESARRETRTRRW